MQTNFYTRFTALITFLSVISLSAPAQEHLQRKYDMADRPVLRGERPVPDYSHVPESDINPVIVRIRINDSYSELLNAGPLGNGPDGYVQFGIPGIDNLNRRMGVTNARQTFFIAIRNKRYESRHNRWGLPLWYDLRIRQGEDVRRVMSLYAALPEVQSAELIVKAKLSSANGVKAASYAPNDSLYPQQWHYHNTGQAGGTPGCDIHLPEAWDIEKGDTGVIISIMDQGIDFSHPDLEANMWPGIGYNFHSDTSLVEKCLHGTHVAGTIAANTNNGKGVSGIAGGDGSGNGVRIMSCQIISAENQVEEANIPNAYIWAADRGAAVSQNSWNLPTASPALLDAIDYFIVNGGGSALNGGIMICSAGNDDTSAITYPVGYEPCMAVAATSNQDKRSFYSNYGPWVDLTAPGGNFYPFNEEDILSTVPGGGYGFLMGTSMACPHVSGVAALIISHAKGMLNQAEVKDILLNSTDDISSLNPDYQGMIGVGRLNAYKALILTQGYINPDIPRPVATFSAVAGNSGKMNLQWYLNEIQDSVMLAYSESKVFGVPSGYYHPGDLITGGGKVLYKGKLTGFEQTSLDSATVYYYSIWSVRNSVYSLIARQASDTMHSAPYGLNDQFAKMHRNILVIPNPAFELATLEFELNEPGQGVITVYNHAGRNIGRYTVNFSQAGNQQIQMNVSGWPSGVYQIRLETGKQTATGRMTVGNR